VAIFGTGIALQTNTVTSSAHLVWTANSTALAALSPAITVHDVTIINTGSVTVYLGTSSVTAATGLALPSGAQLTYNGYVATTGTTTNDIYGITSSGTTTTEAALATVNANV